MLVDKCNVLSNKALCTADKLSNKNSKDNFSSIHSPGRWGGEESGGGKEYLRSEKNSELFGGEKRGGMIYIKALRNLLKDQKRVNPGLVCMWLCKSASLYVQCCVPT